MASTIKCIQVTITGNLRDRGLRFSTMYIAYSLKVKGVVQYNSAGDIVIEAEADEEQLDKFIAWLRNFIKDWKISDFSIVATAPKGYSTFELRNSPCKDVSTPHKVFTVKYMGLFFRKARRIIGYNKHQNLQRK